MFGSYASGSRLRALRKLLGLLNERVAGRFRLFEIFGRPDDLGDQGTAATGAIRALVRKAEEDNTCRQSFVRAKLAERIVELSPEKTDIIFTKQGETIRFLGLPFARVRTIAGVERAWFGIDRNRRPLNENSWSDLVDLVDELEARRTDDPSNKRHEFYRALPEAWLESILRRNIKQLDANLILSPIYNQFRASADKIDLLAIRRDGRLDHHRAESFAGSRDGFSVGGLLAKDRAPASTRRARADPCVWRHGDFRQTGARLRGRPALSFHRDFGYFAKALRPEVEVWRFELREDWRSEIKVLTRRNYPPLGCPR